MKQGASAQKYGYGLATGKSAISTSNYGGRRYAANQNMMDPREMWKDPSMLRQAEADNAELLEDVRVFGTVKRCEDDTEYFETDPDAEREVAPE